VRARERVFAIHARAELVNGLGVDQLAGDPEQRRLLVRVLVVGGVDQLPQVEAVLLRGDDVENRGLGDGRVLQQLQQQPRGVVPRGGQRPGDGGDGARILLRERLASSGNDLLSISGVRASTNATVSRLSAVESASTMGWMAFWPRPCSLVSAAFALALVGSPLSRTSAIRRSAR
jgi:hypothetical protein